MQKFSYNSKKVLKELGAGSGGASSASDVSYDGTTSGLSATNVQSAIDEVVSDIPTVPETYQASAITYDNTSSGLTADDVQDAIDELKSDIPTTNRLVEVVADGVKTYSELLNALYAEVWANREHIERLFIVFTSYAGTTKSYYTPQSVMDSQNSKYVTFAMNWAGNSVGINVKETGSSMWSLYYDTDQTPAVWDYNDSSSSVARENAKIELFIQ